MKAAVGDAGFVCTLFGQSIKAQDAQVLGLNQKESHTPHQVNSCFEPYLSASQKNRATDLRDGRRV
jgi:hypothetical protein